MEKLVKALLNVKLSETDDEKHVSILDLPGSILIVPLATLGGKMKGKMIQYHKNIGKERGEQLYALFIDLIRKQTNENAKWRAAVCRVENGTYGIRQVYSTDTNGPYLHFIEL